MDRFSRTIAKRLLAAGLCAGLSAVSAMAQVSVRSLKVLGSKDVVEVEVEASDRITPETQVLTGPDRLVIDFPNARPNADLRSQSVDRGDVKDVRVGLFQSKPPITRVVIDLKAARSFQVFPYGRTVMIKVVGAPSNAVAQQNGQAQPGAQPQLVAANFTAGSAPVHIEAVPEPPLQVSYLHGMLSIRSNKATLSEVLYAVQQKTGADIAIPAGAEQEQVVASVEPAPAPEVLARLLNGSRFNFLILSAPDDPKKLDRVILSTRTEGNFIAPLPPMQNEDGSGEDDQPAAVQNNEQPQPDNPVPPAEAQMPQQTRDPQEGVDTPQQQ
jgi:AMIN domain-containing protein